MFRYILKRILLLVIALFVIITIAFFLMQLIPGYPKAVAEKIAMAKTPEEAQAIINTYNLAETNPFVLYGNYMAGLFRGDLGMYYANTNLSIWSLFMKPMAYTMMVAIPSFILGTVLGIVFGFISGYKRGKLPDVAVNIFAVFFVSVPSFILAIGLIFFGKAVGLPIEFAKNAGFWGQMESLILPILIMTLTSFATLTYYVRNEVVEVLSSDFITIAKAKGVSEKRLLFKHVMRNVSIPMITIILPSFVFMISGSMIVEIFFNVPGSSTIFAQAVQNGETYVVMFSVLFYSTLSMLTTLVTDILYVILDPRIRLVEKNKKSFVTSIKNELIRKNNLKKEIQNANN